MTSLRQIEAGMRLQVQIIPFDITWTHEEYEVYEGIMPCLVGPEVGRVPIMGFKCE